MSVLDAVWTYVVVWAGVAVWSFVGWAGPRTENGRLWNGPTRHGSRYDKSELEHYRRARRWRYIFIRSPLWPWLFVQVLVFDGKTRP